MSNLDEFKKGLLKENPTLVGLLGMCPTLAITTTALNGIGMGLATTFVLVGSNLVISLLKKAIPRSVKRLRCVSTSALTRTGRLLSRRFVP